LRRGAFGGERVEERKENVLENLKHLISQYLNVWNDLVHFASQIYDKLKG